MNKAQAIMFTDDELRTLVWALNNQYHRTFRNNLEAGKPGKSETTKRIVNLSKIVYGELIRRNKLYEPGNPCKIRGSPLFCYYLVFSSVFKALLM